MANMIDYLHWRGDLDFSKSPFNEVDAAIFAMLSYVNMSGVVPGWDSNSRISINDAIQQIIAKYYPDGEKPKNSSEIVPTFSAKFNNDLEEAFRTLSSCPRYEGVWLFGFEKNTDFVEGQQFAAVTFSLPASHPDHVVAFRGTDNTFVGWKEDFGLAYLEQVPAQESARQYLEQALKKLHGQVVVCGHSKGGNLAIFAAAHAGSRFNDRIAKVLNFDGPGFDFKLMDKIPFDLCRDKVINFVPEESTVGMLLEPVGERRVVSSQSHSAYQHNAFFWNVARTEFVRGNLSDSAKMLDGILDSWLAELPLPDRKSFFEAVFDLLGDVDETISSKDPLNNLTYITNTLKKYQHLDKDTKSLINLVFGTLTTQTTRTLTTTIQQRLPAVTVKRNKRG
jgi:hypothetical protein